MYCSTWTYQHHQICYGIILAALAWDGLPMTNYNDYMKGLDSGFVNVGELLLSQITTLV